MNTSTKEKILEVAGKLFAKSGYDGTSIRDISTEAGVNLASVNYHFKNKQNLYREVMNFNIAHIEGEIERIAKEHSSLTDFSWALYLYFVEESTAFINSFKLFITNTLPADKDIIPDRCFEKYGPPGVDTMLKMVTDEVGEDCPHKGRQWAVHIIFDQIVHLALIMSSSFLKLMEDEIPYLKIEEKKKSLEFSVQAILNFLKENPDKFRDN